MRTCLIGLACLAIVSVSCDDGLSSPPIGAVLVSVTTTGGDFDLDGYKLSVDGAVQGSVDTIGTVLIPDLHNGEHAVTLSGLAVNCEVDAAGGPNPRSVMVTGGDTTAVTFLVHCVATGVQIAAPTSGPDGDPDGYTVSVDGAAPVAVPTGGVVTLTRLGAGTHTLELDGVADNCMVDDPRPRSVTLDIGDVATVTFAVSCLAVTGSVQVAAATSGVDLDTDGYRVQVGDNGTQYQVPVNGAITVEGLPAGTHTIRLSDVSANCTVAGDNPRTVSVTTGGAIRDTARTTFEASCVSTTGTLVVSTVTSGDELDPNGYTVFVADCYDWNCDYLDSRPMGVNGIDTIPSVPVGTHAVWLEGVARNCHVDEEPGSVTIAPGDTTQVGFAVACPRTGSLQLTVTTTGDDPDSAYSLTVRGLSYDTIAVVAANAAVTISEVPAGDYSVTLDGVAPNCDVAGAETATTTVPSGGSAAVGFGVTCTGFGSVQLTVTTTGVDLDSDGYNVYLAGTNPFSESVTVGVNETITIPELPGDDYTVTLDGLALNCDPASPNPITATVPSGGMKAVTFDVTCVQARDLAVTVTGADGRTTIYRVKANGSGLTPLATDASQPAWSPDGGQIAFVSMRDGSAEIYVMDGDGSRLARLTSNGADDVDPAWSPDGSKIAFTSKWDGNADVYVINADGTDPVRLTFDPGVDADPAWAPDGSRIAFTSDRDGNSEIYVMNADGSGATRLTFDDADDRDPAWSPDGARLAFSRASWCAVSFCELHVMNADGSAATRIATAPGTAEYGSSDLGPAWSPDGNWIAYGATHIDCPWGCYVDYTAVEAVRPDGTRAVEIVRNAAEPAWRP